MIPHDFVCHSQIRQNNVEISTLKADLDSKFREIYDLKSASLATLLLNTSSSAASPLRASSRGTPSGMLESHDSDELQSLRVRVQSLSVSLADKEAQFEVLAHHQSLAEVTVSVSSVNIS